jgi:hypothetical protein
VKRWLLVITPALVIVLLGGALIVLTDSDPEPLPPLASLETPSLAPSPTPVTGPTGSTGPTGLSGIPRPTGPTAFVPAIPTTDASDDGSNGGGGPAGGGGGGKDEPVTVTLILTQAGFVVPMTAQATPGSTVVIQATSIDVTDTVVVQGLDRSVDVSPGKIATLEVEVDKPGTFPIVLQGSGVVVGNILVVS